MQTAIFEKFGVNTEVLAMFSEEEHALIGRHLRSHQTKETVFEFTRDVGFLHQYYVLRSRDQVRSWSLASHRYTLEDEQDRQSHVLVARRGNQVMAGGRLTISSPRKALKLPMEENGFSLTKAFPQLNLQNRKYAEVSRVVIETEFQDEASMTALMKHLHRKVIASRVEQIFALVPSVMVDTYKKITQQAGVILAVHNTTEFPELETEDGTKVSLLTASISLNNDIPAEDFVAEDDRQTVSIL